MILCDNIILIQSFDVPEAICENDTQCQPAGRVFTGGNGPTTGTCLTEGSCEIYAWCPTQNENKTLTYVKLQLTYSAGVLCYMPW